METVCGIPCLTTALTFSSYKTAPLRLCVNFLAKAQRRGLGVTVLHLHS